MIYDKLENFEKYVGAHEEFKTVAEFIKNNDLLALPVGKAPINDKVFYNRQSYMGKPDTDKYESHIKYIDVQIVLKGAEKIKYSATEPVIDELNEKLIRKQSCAGFPPPWAPTKEWDGEWSNDRRWS